MRYLFGPLWRGAGIVLLVLASANPVHVEGGWTVTDLGTLGGPISNAEDINEAGHVVGGSDRDSGSLRFAFLWTPSGGMRDLGTLGGLRSEAVGINNAGQVVGSSSLAGGPGGSTHAFLWTETAGMVDLGYLGELFPGFAFSGANDINDAGQVVGGSSTPGGSHAFLWTPAGGMVDLGTLGGANSVAHAINDTGQVVGRAETASGDEHAFLWTAAGGMVDLGTFGGLSSDAHDINEAGQVVGRSDTASGDVHAFLWTAAGGMVDLGTIGSPGSRIQAEGINDAGQVVGLFNDAIDGNDRAFYWTAAGGMVELPTLTGIESGARAINNAGQLAGYGDIDTGDGHAVVWINATNPPSPEEQIISLEASVQDLVTGGSLKPSQSNGLTKPLQNALRSLAKGQLAPACSQLHDFQVEVARKVLGGALTPGEGVALIDAATRIRTTLGC